MTRARGPCRTSRRRRRSASAHITPPTHVVMEAYKLHPLVLVNVSDHYTRMKAQLSAGEEPARVLGCLLGYPTGNREVEICNSFEVKWAPNDEGLPTFDAEYLGQQQERYKKVFPQWDIVGWYGTGEDVVPSVDLHIHRSLGNLNESPVYLLFDPRADLGGGGHSSGGDGGKGVASKDLPFTLYETVVHASSEGTAAVQTFERAEYKIETVEAERISVDHVARMSREQSSQGARYVAHLGGVASAVEMLNVRVEALLRYLKEVDEGRVPADHAVLRAANQLVKQLPATDSQKFRDNFLAEYNDTLLVTYLAAVTKGAAEMDVYTSKFNTAYDKHARRRGF